MSHYVPSIGKLVGAVFSDSNGSKFSEGTELRACSRTSLKPDDERNSLILIFNAVAVSTEEAVIHSGLPFAVIPIDFLIALINKLIPE
jgi:hypothetical protein